MREIKIAVCMSRQIRTAEYCAPWIKESFNFDTVSKTLIWHKGKAFQTFQPQVERDLKFSVDYFCDFKEKSTSGHVIGGHGPRIIQREEIERLIQVYNPKKYTITTAEFEDSAKIWDRKPFTAQMFSSICRSVYLKQQYEVEQGQFYDWVFISRYDTLIGPRTDSLPQWLSLAGVHPLAIYKLGTDLFFPRESFMHGFIDMFLWGTSFSIDALTARLYSDWATNHDPDMYSSRATGPNTQLHLATHDAGLREMTSQPSWAIVRDCANLSLPVFESFDYHQLFWTENAPWVKK